jgi:hypothetical protein
VIVWWLLEGCCLVWGVLLLFEGFCWLFGGLVVVWRFLVGVCCESFWKVWVFVLI